MSSTSLGRQISLLNSPRLVRLSCVSCVLCQFSCSVESERNICQVLFYFFFHNSNLEYIAVAVFV